MKTRILYLLVVCATLGHLTAQDVGKVIIRNSSINNPKFIVSLNGIRQNNQYTSNISFDFLDDYNYRVKILQLGATGSLNFNITSAPNYVSIYVLNKDPYGTYALILESKTVMGNQPPNDPPVVNNPPPFPPNNGNNSVDPQNTLSDADYRGIYETIKNESFEATRLDMAKTFFGTKNCYSTQVLGIMGLFTTEESKLDFAKFAYPKTMDSQSYFKVYDAFSFSESKQQLSSYIKNMPATPPTSNYMPNKLNNTDYLGMCEAIKKESFETTKLDMAKTMIGSVSLSSSQVLGITKLFSFEKNKLDFAKFAYSKTYDKQSYFKVYDAFTFSNSKKELSDYMKSNP